MLDDVAFLEQHGLKNGSPLGLAPGQELERHREVLELLFLGVLQNGLIISSISIYYQNVITGAVLVLSVLIDRFRQSRAGRAT